MVKIIKNKNDHDHAMKRITELMATHPAVGSALGNELELLAHLVQDYEQSTTTSDCASAAGNSIPMEQQKSTPGPKDLIPDPGSASRARKCSARQADPQP